MSLAYRGLEYAAERRWAEATSALEESRAPMAYERRAGRAFGGLVGTIGGLVVFASALLNVPRLSGGRDALVGALLGSGVTAVAAYLLGRAWARLRTQRMLSRAPRRSGDAVTDVAALDAYAPGAALQRLASALEFWSVLLQMVALSLLAPLTLHALVAGAIGDYAGFDSWIRTSAIIVGHAHLVLCICCAMYARSVCRSSSEALVERGDRDWWRALGYTTMAAAVPGVILMAVPPLLTLVTGAMFVPAMYRTIRSHVVAERSALAMLR